MVFPEICAAKRVEYLPSNIGSLICSVHLAPVLYVIGPTTDDPTVRTVSFAVASALLIANPVFSANTVVSTTIIELGLAISTTLGATGAAVANGALVGFVNGYFASGGGFGAALQGGIIGGVSGGVTDQIGHGGIFTGENAWFSQALAHGVFQGLISEIQGGEFQAGLASGFVAKVGGHYLEGTALDNVAGVSILGGLASKAAGGDFLQGAIQAAFVYMYNDQQVAQQESLTNPTGGTIRSDSEGDGNYGAPRGNRSHRGIDITSVDGQGVVSPADGTAVNFTGATTGYPIVDITPSDQSLNIDLIRILYVGPSSTNSGGRYNVSQGGLIGNSVNLQGLGYSNGVTPHVHIQIQSGGQWVDPTPYFFPSGP